MDRVPGHSVRGRRLRGALVGILLAAALPLAGGGAASAAAVPVGCVAAGDVAVIVDDSGSMARSDPLGLRRRATELLLTKPTGQQRTVGAVEFGEDAGSLFAPAQVGGARGSMLAALGALDDDGWLGSGGSTDYDAAFAAAAEQQPAADARIFLTDGGHNDGAYLDGHVGGPRTYVVGLGIGPARTGSDAATLERIARETGGAYFPLDRTGRDGAALQASRLQSVFNEIDALLDCTTVATRRTVALRRQGRSSRPLTFSFGGRAAIELVTSWVSDRATIDVASIVVCDRRGRVIADLRGRKARRGRPRRIKLTVRKVRGGTYVTVVVRRPRRGVTVKVRVKGTRLPRRERPTVQARPLDDFPAAPPPAATPAPAPAPPADPAPPAAPEPPAPEPPPVTPPRPPRRVDPYDNYGPANAGRAICRGNPGRPESMPGGTVSQTFAVPAGVASIDRALVQIDPDDRVTAHATLHVNGHQRAAATAAAAGDTTFAFAAIPVRAGDTAMLRIAFTATFGKIVTVYTAGAPGGTFVASNSCPDGAPNVTTGATGLRAVVSGWDR
ncbi:vWA domain-containing protein [Conexibacter arvalis]|uniref:VWFA domain-containing protein n=1 Tax=Conexibacter arvalis TaxID=912552 RepID=A0A840ID07_9ACTN|nr:vWA domain-containing protein [Conexibacter arvalis]MBB4662827.1 hypothetical protein [Conexibacter arvalis]